MLSRLLQLIVVHVRFERVKYAFAALLTLDVVEVRIVGGGIFNSAVALE